MSTRDLLARMRRGETPENAALETFAKGLADGNVSDAQAGAFAMAVCTGPGLGEAGRVALTRAMARSGAGLAWNARQPVLDKHSTGGVGDPVSLALAPALAALGAVVPMVSGRGLGHTGGTLDKLEAIPGVTTEHDEAGLRRIVERCGCAIVAATETIAPADRRLYAIRDVTGTVDQIDLITASILSKKLAAGVEALVLDVKAGRGAFMADAQAAGELARTLVKTARGAGCPTVALVTAMEEPLAPACGNAVEVREVLSLLCGGGDARFGEIVVELGAEALLLGRLVGDIDAGRRHVADVLASGAAAERFGRMVAEMGGPSDLLERPETHLASAPVIRDVAATEGGTVSAIDGAALGRAVIALGGGRSSEGDAIDPTVGLDGIVRIGARLGPGEAICRIHAASVGDADAAAERVRHAVSFGRAPDPGPLVLERVA